MTSDHSFVVSFSDAAPGNDLAYVADGRSDNDVTALVNALGWLLRRVREARGLTQTDVALQCELTTSSLCRFELSKRPLQLRQALRLCDVLNIRLSDAMRLVEDEVFPLGRSEPTDHPIDLVGQPPGAATRRAIARGGESAPRQSL